MFFVPPLGMLSLGLMVSTIYTFGDGSSLNKISTETTSLGVLSLINFPNLTRLNLFVIPRL